MLIILAFLLIELLRNYYLIDIKKKSPDHGFNFALRVIPLVALYYYTTNWHFLTPDWQRFGQAVIAFVSIFWFGFDTVLNLLRGEPVDYLGDSAIDMFQKNHPNADVWFYFKAIFFVFGVLQWFFDSNPF